jgi:hypothetical protein
MTQNQMCPTDVRAVQTEQQLREQRTQRPDTGRDLPRRA